MTNETIHTADGREMELTKDTDDIDAYATGLTVAVGRKISTKQYENAEPYASIRAEVRPALALDADGAIDALRGQAERLGRVVSHHVNQVVTHHRENANERKGLGR